MRAYLLHLCEHCGIVRAGPFAFRKPDPYLFSETFVRVTIDGILWAELIGFDQKELDHSAYEAGIRCINQDAKLLVTYERVPMPGVIVRSFQINPAKVKGKILMGKKTIPHVNDAKHLEDHRKALGHLVQQVDAGHYGFKDWEQKDLGNGEVRISVTRFEIDPKVKAEPHDTKK